MNQYTRKAIALFKEASFRLMLYRTSILLIIAMIMYRLATGQNGNHIMMAVFIALLAFAFYFRRRQEIAVFEDEILFNTGIAFAFSKQMPIVQQFALENLVRMHSHVKKSLFAGPTKKMLEFQYADGSSNVMNCTLFSMEDFEQLKSIVARKLPEEPPKGTEDDDAESAA